MILKVQVNIWGKEKRSSAGFWCCEFIKSKGQKVKASKKQQSDIVWREHTETPWRLLLVDLNPYQTNNKAVLMMKKKNIFHSVHVPVHFQRNATWPINHSSIRKSPNSWMLLSLPMTHNSAKKQPVAVWADTLLPAACHRSLLFVLFSLYLWKISKTTLKVFLH